MTLAYNIVFSRIDFFSIFNKSLSILQGLVHIITVSFFFFFYIAPVSRFFSFPSFPSPFSLLFRFICTFKKHLSMKCTQHHTIRFIVNEFSQIFLEIVYYPSPARSPSLSHNGCDYILVYDVTLMLSLIIGLIILTKEQS